MLTFEETKLVERFKEDKQMLLMRLQTEEQRRRQAELKLKSLTAKIPKILKPVTIAEIYEKVFKRKVKIVWSEKFYREQDVIPILAKLEQCLSSELVKKENENATE